MRASPAISMWRWESRLSGAGGSVQETPVDGFGWGNVGRLFGAGVVWSSLSAAREKAESSSVMAEAGGIS